MLISKDDKRFHQLYEAALNLGMSAADATHYAEVSRLKEIEADARASKALYDETMRTP